MKDGQNSVRKVVDTAGSVVASYDYDAWGNTLSDANAIDVLFHHRAFGEVLDPNLGMTYLRARWMDPSTGRFGSRDPFQGLLARPSTLGRYRYGSSNPVNELDPSGLFSLPDALVAIAIVGILAVQALGAIAYARLSDEQLNQPPDAKIFGYSRSRGWSSEGIGGGGTGSIEFLSFNNGVKSWYYSAGIYFGYGGGIGGSSHSYFSGGVRWNRDLLVGEPAAGDYEGPFITNTFPVPGLFPVPWKNKIATTNAAFFYGPDTGNPSTLKGLTTPASWGFLGTATPQDARSFTWGVTGSITKYWQLDPDPSGPVAWLFDAISELDQAWVDAFVPPPPGAIEKIDDTFIRSGDPLDQ